MAASLWDAVHPRYWHPDVAINHFHQDKYETTIHSPNRELNPYPNPYPRTPRSKTKVILPDSHLNDELCHDLPMVLEEDEDPINSSELENQQKTLQRDDEDEEQLRKNCKSFAYRTASYDDENGQTVASTYRRYEGKYPHSRFKAVHDRKVNGKRCKQTWTWNHGEIDGKYCALCSHGTQEDFEKVWANTTFVTSQDHEWKIFSDSK